MNNKIFDLLIILVILLALISIYYGDTDNAIFLILVAILYKE